MRASVGKLTQWRTGSHGVRNARKLLRTHFCVVIGSPAVSGATNFSRTDGISGVFSRRGRPAPGWWVHSTGRFGSDQFDKSTGTSSARVALARSTTPAGPPINDEPEANEAHNGLAAGSVVTDEQMAMSCCVRVRYAAL